MQYLKAYAGTVDYRALQMSTSTLKDNLLLSCFLHLFTIQLTHRNHKPLLTKYDLQDIQRTTHMALRLKTLNSTENTWKLLLT